MNTFTEATLLSCGATQQAVVAMLRINTEAYKPHGACPAYYSYIRRALSAIDAVSFAAVARHARNAHSHMFSEFLVLLETVDPWVMEEFEAVTSRAETAQWGKV